MQGMERCSKSGPRSLRPAAAAVVLSLGWIGQTGAAIIDSGNPDVSLTWDNTVRYNAGVRVQKRDTAIANTPLMNAGDHAFDKGDLVTNRLDLLSEFLFDYKKQFGFKVSGSAWVDGAYGKGVKQNPALAALGTYDNNEFSDFTKRYYKGPSGEFIDAYAYGSFDLGTAPTSAKLGRHTVLWGEAVALSAASVSAGQAPVDVRKLFSSPGATAKEVAMPIGQLSAVSQVTPELSLAGQYYYEWRESRIPEGGTYLMDVDFLFNGPNKFGVLPLVNAGMRRPKGAGDWGLSARWTPESLDRATLGFYAREYTEKLFWLNIGAGGAYQTSFAEGVKLYGISLSKNLGGVSFGAEMSIRKNAALNSTNTDANFQGARGNTFQMLFNGIRLGGGTALWNSSVAIAELGYSRVNSVTANKALYKGCEVTGTSIDQGCMSRDAWQTFLMFSPTWAAVAPGLDLSASASLMYGLRGNSATVDSTAHYKGGSYGVGISADYNNKHKFSLAYNGYLATHNLAGGVVVSSNGSQVQDRGWLSFTYETSY